jgi:hypothetical protein
MGVWAEGSASASSRSKNIPQRTKSWRHRQQVINSGGYFASRRERKGLRLAQHKQSSTGRVVEYAGPEKGLALEERLRDIPVRYSR